MHYLQRTLHVPGILCSKHHYNRAISEILRHPGNIISHVSWLFELWLGLQMQELKYIKKRQFLCLYENHSPNFQTKEGQVFLLHSFHKEN